MLPFVAPFILYLLLTQIPGEFPELYPGLYAASVVITGTAAIILLRGTGIIKIHRNVLPGIIVGLAGIVIWILISRLNLEAQISAYLPEFLKSETRPAFNPFESIKSSAGQAGFIAVRLLGLAVLVPVAEELFWRGYLMRWIISDDWESQKIGVYTPKSFLLITGLFTLAHPEWFAAAVWCTMINLLLYWKRDLWNCIVAHGVSNLTLGIYVLATSSWELW
ncbi:MAG: CAAX prenyl protease-related protein [Nitrospira sp.]|nr:CAAX prenyl protease-related protein [bacterium]MBL7047922.1 CAAX prenyl protease-related protein [Nitrospira sp.]